MPNADKYKYLLHIAILLVVSCLLLACGKKGDPTLKSYEKPATPSDFGAVHREKEIVLFWNFPKGAEQSIKGFQIMKSTDGGFKKAAFVENSQRSYADKDFQPGQKCKYKILSESLKGVLSSDSKVIEMTPNVPPASPSDVSFSIEHDQIALKWNAVGERVLYNVYKSDKHGDFGMAPLNREPLKETSFRDGFSVKKPAFYTVRSLFGGDARDEGPASKEIVVDPAELVPPAVEGLQAVVRPDSVYLIWKEPAEQWVTGYRIYRHVEKMEGYALLGESQTPTFVDKDKPLTKRSYRITALGPSKEGPPAEIRDVLYKKPK